MNWIVIVLVLLVLLGIGGAVLWLVLSSKPEPTPTPKKEECAFTENPGMDSDGVPPCDDEGCTMEGASLEACLQACCDREACVAAQYRHDKQRCLLKDEAAPLAPAASAKTLYEKK